MKRIALTVIATLAVVLIGGLIFINSGLYNIAASEEHSGLELWALETTKRHSVRRQARDIVPPDLTRSEMILYGAGAYHSMCAICHGAPGIERSALARGLNPEPPSPASMVSDWTDAEIFWIIKHGLRMTGMPGWGPTHDDHELWEIVAFLKEIPNMSAEEYQRMVEAAPEHHHDGQRPRPKHDHDHRH